MLLHEFYMKIRRAVLLDRKLDQGGEASPLDWNDDVVVVFYIQPPQRQVNALCAIDYDHINSSNLLADPVSLCIAGGLQSKIQHFCTEYGKSHGNSKRYYIGLYGLFLFSLVFFIPLLIRDTYFQSYHVFFWIAVAYVSSIIAEKAHKTSTQYLDSKCQFWRSWMDSGLEMNLLGVLGRCGYYFEIAAIDHRWKLSLYKKDGEASSLPLPSGGDDDDQAKESALKVWDAFERAGILERHCHPSENNQVDDIVPPNPLDFWMIRGLFLGRILNTRMHLRATQIFGSCIFVSFVLSIAILPISLPWLLFVYFVGIIVCIAAIVIFYDLVDKPSLHLAQEKLCRRLSPLIQDRHSGYTLVYETKPIKGSFFRMICCWMKQGVFVLKSEAPSTNHVDC